MSVIIDTKKCIGCGSCQEVCPGNLIRADERGRAFLRRPRDCWGCTSCLKACPAGAIRFYLAPDIGGRGAQMSVERRGDLRTWIITSPDGSEKRIEVNARSANRY